MKTLYLLIAAWVLAGTGPCKAQEPVTRARNEVKIPDIPGWLTLKCDWHTHTVFSDGLVWPTVRVEEAWREGLNAIAITDHIEYQPHKKDISTNHNRGYEIAHASGVDLDVLVVSGSEITRKMPPGHLNAIFLTNANMLAVSDWQDAIQAAHDQGAFIFWNHPGWEAQTTNGLVVWYPEHTALLEQGKLHGIEVVNGRAYYPEAHRWAIEKKLTMISNSDIHSPLNLDYHLHDGDHRPMTLVFSKDHSPAAIKEALFDRRTAVYSGDLLIGDEQYLRPIFERSVRVGKTAITVKGKGRALIPITNTSDVDYRLQPTSKLDDLKLPKECTLAGGKTVLLTVQGASDKAQGTRSMTMTFAVTNLLTGPSQCMTITIPMQVTFAPTTTK